MQDWTDGLVILTGPEIRRQHASGNIRISEYDPICATTNSYDLRLGARVIRYTDEVLDPRSENNYETIHIGPDGYRLDRGEFVLAETAERIGSDHFVPIIHARSGIARLGLFVHCTADLIDIGSYGKSTLQLHATLPVRLFTGMKIAQVSFWQPTGEIRLYDGKYMGADGPMPSLAYHDD